MDIKRSDEKLIKDIEKWNKSEISTKCELADDTTEREKYLEQRCEELENRIRKMEIENNLMRELLSRPITYTYGIR